VIKRPWLVVTAGVLILALWILPPVLFWLFDLQLDHPVLAGVLWIICGYPFALIVLMKNRYVVEIDEIRGVLTVETFNLLLHKSVRSVPFGDIDSVQFAPSIPSDGNTSGTLPSPFIRTRVGEEVALHPPIYKSILDRFKAPAVASDKAMMEVITNALARRQVRHWTVP
jgi:hypothetical protein